jgi:hypothetical protein
MNFSRPHSNQLTWLWFVCFGDLARRIPRFQSGGSRGDLGGDFRGEFCFGAREVIGDLKAQLDRGRAVEVAGEA